MSWKFLRKSIDARQRKGCYSTESWCSSSGSGGTEGTGIYSPNTGMFRLPGRLSWWVPAGRFVSGLRLIELGKRPIVLERGKCVEERKTGSESFVQKPGWRRRFELRFRGRRRGTFSDGKLFTGSKKRGNVDRILEILVYHGANSNILIDAHPHIGTDNTPSDCEYA